MNNIKVYKPKFDPCKICNEQQAMFLLLCKIDGDIKMFPVCRKCHDKIPYEIIPVKGKVGQGYFYFNGKAPKIKPIIVEKEDEEFQNRKRRSRIYGKRIDSPAS